MVTFALTAAAVVPPLRQARADEVDASTAEDASTSAYEPAAEPVPIWTPPGKRNTGLIVAGAITTTIGLLPSAFGLAMIIGDEARHDDWYDGLGTQAGGFLLGIGIAHLAAGIPMLVVGATPQSPDMAQTKPIISVKVGAASASLQVDF